MSEISVVDICTEAGVSRSTFYRLFDSTFDVLEYSSKVIVAKTIEDYSQKKFDNDLEFVLFTFIYWHRNEDILEAAINCGRTDLIAKTFEAQSEKLIPLFRHDFTEVEMEYIRECSIGLISSLLVVWLRRGKKETPTEIFQLYKKFYFREMEGFTSRENLIQSLREKL